MNINDVDLGNLVYTKSNAAQENSSSGVGLYAVSSIESDGGSPTYSMSGDGGKFAINSSTGAITTTGSPLDFETTKSYSLTLTATVGSDTTSTTVNVPVQNVEETEAATVRYSAEYHNLSRTGFSATAARNISGAASAHTDDFVFQQVGTTNTNLFSSAANANSRYFDVEVAPGTATNLRFTLPFDPSNASVGTHTFNPNESDDLDMTVFPNLGSHSTYDIGDGDDGKIITAAKASNKFWFAALNNDQPSFTMTTVAASNSGAVNAIGLYNGYGLLNGSTSWTSAAEATGGSLTTYSSPTSMPSLSGIDLVIDQRLGHNQNFSSSAISFIQGGGIYFDVVWEWNNGCCNASRDKRHAKDILDGLGINASGVMTFNGTNTSTYSGSSTLMNVPDTSSGVLAGSSIDYSPLSGLAIQFGAAGLLSTLPTGCTGLITGNSIFICDPGHSSNSGFSGAYIGIADVNALDGYSNRSDNYELIEWVVGLAGATVPAQTKTVYFPEDTVIVAGEVYKESDLTAYMGNSPTGAKKVLAFMPLPVENINASGTANDFHVPNFISPNIWQIHNGNSSSYAGSNDVGMDYCSEFARAGVVGSCDKSAASTYKNHYLFGSELAAIGSGQSESVQTSRFIDFHSDFYHKPDSISFKKREIPEGMSMWWQILLPWSAGATSVGVGLWAQLSFDDDYDGTNDNRKSQSSLLNVVISNLFPRRTDTTRYSEGDTGVGLDGFHFASYQQYFDDSDPSVTYARTLGPQSYFSTLECATAHDSSCFWGASNANYQPRGMMITNSDPYKKSAYTVPVSYSMDSDAFMSSGLNQGLIVQRVSNGSAGAMAQDLSVNDFRSAGFYASDANNYVGYFTGIMEFDQSGNTPEELAIVRSNGQATFTFDDTNDFLSVDAPLTVSSLPSTGYTNTWSDVKTGSLNLKFGDLNNSLAKSAYISKEVFAAELQDNGVQIGGSSGGTSNTKGVMVSWNTLDRQDYDLFKGDESDYIKPAVIPDTEYSQWGFWAMSSLDVSADAGTQTAGVHMGTWVAGEALDQSEIPTSGQATMSGAAVFKVASRSRAGTDGEIYKYTTTANVVGTFNWGASGYTGNIAFSKFDIGNSDFSAAGFTSFAISISGSGAEYSGSWTQDQSGGLYREAWLAGTLYGDDAPDESGGRVGVSLWSPSQDATEVNKIFHAEGIYLID